MRRSLVTLGLLLVMVAAAPAADAATLGPRFVGGSGERVKPPQIGVGAKGVWQGLRWTDWGRRRATARGVYDVAGFSGERGTGYRSRIFMTVSGRKACPNGSRIYTRVRWRVRKPFVGRRVFSERFSTCPG